MSVCDAVRGMITELTNDTEKHQLLKLQEQMQIFSTPKWHSGLTKINAQKKKKLLHGENASHIYCFQCQGFHFKGKDKNHNLH